MRATRTANTLFQPAYFTVSSENRVRPQVKRFLISFEIRSKTFTAPRFEPAVVHVLSRPRHEHYIRPKPFFVLLSVVIQSLTV
jgi:hypothetical protein